MKAIIIDNTIQIFSKIPYFWNKIEGYNYSDTEQLKIDGWKDIIYPVYDTSTQYLGSEYYDEVNDIVTFPVLNKTIYEIENEKLLNIRALQDDLIKKIQMELLLETVQSFDDTKAEINKGIYPLWETGISVTTGSKYQDFNNDGDIVLWKVVKSHTTQSDWRPRDVPSLWSRIGYDEQILDWVQPTGSHDAYNIGDKVKYEGFIYQSTVNANVYHPNLVENQWIKL